MVDTIRKLPQEVATPQIKRVDSVITGQNGIVAQELMPSPVPQRLRAPRRVPVRMAEPRVVCIHGVDDRGRPYLDCFEV